MKRAVFFAVFLTAALTLFLSGAGVLFAIHSQTAKEQWGALKTEATFLLKGYNAGGAQFIESLERGRDPRVTLIDADGWVLYDSLAGETELENHGKRPEVEQALKEGESFVERQSSTIGKKTCYVAYRTNDGKVIRLSTEEEGLIRMIDKSATVIGAILLLCALLAAALARQITETMIAPINKLNLDAPLENDIYEEFSPLLLRMDRQNRRIEEQMLELQTKRQEFSLITENMEEAFTVFSSEGRVLSANRAAKRFFGRYDTEDLHYGALGHAAPFLEMMKRALEEGESSEEKYEYKGRIYRLSVHPVKTKEAFGAVFLSSDVTERENAEQIRREFSANVSHELKTPLTTIMACSELIALGVAPAQDHEQLAEQIHKEAKRLLSLISDIIRLSRLDEGQLRDQFEQVDLYLQAQKVLGELKRKAEESDLQVTLEGEHTLVFGVSTALYEMIFNLCDNAVTYNKKGGSIRVVVGKKENCPFILVKDSGIGIEKSEQHRIFERFYRVDKSRSKASGGTGLGLSIVKHTALLHQAQILLDSTPGSGTAITVLFAPDTDPSPKA